MHSTSTTRSDKLAAAIRQRIVSGEFAPGGRLPTFLELETTFSCSRSVAQLAVGRLKSDGFIDTSTRQGLFVVHNPPHLRRYGVVFPMAPANPAWPRFDEVLIQQAHRLHHDQSDREFEIFAGTSDFHLGDQMLTRLRREVNNDRLAGLILTPGCFELAQQHPFNNPLLPKVFIFHAPGSGVGPIVSGDGDSLVDRSLRYLSQQGCRRVAVIRADGAYSFVGPDLLLQHGLEYRPEWVQVIGRGDTVVLETLIPLLLKYPTQAPPDGLFILDDNLINPISAAVVKMGVRVGIDLHIVAHTSWPAKSPCVLPVQRIGYHAGDILDRCIDAIDSQRQGITPPDVQRIPALFENELDRD